MSRNSKAKTGLRLKDVRSRINNIRSFMIRRTSLAVFCALLLTGVTGYQVFGEQIHTMLNPTKLRVLKSDRAISVVPADKFINQSTSLNKLPSDTLTRLANDKHELLKGKAADATHVRTIDTTATSKTYLNKDGTVTKDNYVYPRSFKDGSNWKDIDNTLQQNDKTGVWSTKANSWKATFDKVSSTTGVSITNGNQTATYSPISGKVVKPTVTDVAGKQTVTYKNVWPNVDLQYTINSAELKESIIIKTSDAAKKAYAFNVSGTTLTPDAERPGNYKLDGDLSGFNIAKSSLMTSDNGIIPLDSVLNQKLDGSALTYSIDQTWVDQQSAKAYPMVIDPTTTDAPRGYANYASYVNNGYVCGSGGGCGNSVGNNTNGGYIWRSTTGPSYTIAQNKNYILQSAQLSVSMTRPGEISTPGTYNPKPLYVHRATGNSYNSFNNTYGTASGTIGSSGIIDVTGIYQNAIANQDYGMWLFLTGDESNNYTYKFYDWTLTTLSFVYDAMPVPTVVSPDDNTTVVMPQPHLIGNAINFHDQTMKYKFIVGTNPTDPSQGQTSNSGWQDTPQWTVPEGAVQNGTTYYWYMQSWNGYSNSEVKTSSIRSFKVDLRNGSSTQAYDSVGAFQANMATGNVSMNTASHTISALGGNLGLGLNYNSPLRSQPGLMAQY